MKKFFYLLIAVVIFGGGIWILYHQFFVKESPDYARVINVLLIFAVYIAGYIRYFATRKTTVREVNEDAYGNIIKDAFHNEGEQYDRFMEGIRLYNEDELEKAIELLGGLLTEARTLQEVFAVKFFLGLCYSEQEEFEKEIEIDEELLKLAPDAADVYNNLGNAYNNIDNYERAKELLEKAIELAPDEIEAPINLSYTEYKLGNQERAMELIDGVLERYPEEENAREMRDLIAREECSL